MNSLTWLQAHWLAVFTTWVALNTILSPVAEKVPATTWYGKTLHVFVAVSPMDVMKAIKTVGAALTVPVAGLFAMILVATGCNQTPAAVTADAVLQTEVSTYAAQEQACVANADGSLAAAEACLAGVKAAWCGDGGPLAAYCGGGK